MQQLPLDEQSFESANGLPDPHGHFGLVAERRSRKAKVAGSIPASGKYFCLFSSVVELVSELARSVFRLILGGFPTYLLAISYRIRNKIG